MEFNCPYDIYITPHFYICFCSDCGEDAVIQMPCWQWFRAICEFGKNINMFDQRSMKNKRYGTFLKKILPNLDSCYFENIENNNNNNNTF